MRKIELPLIENELLWVLDEAGAETKATVYATFNFPETEIAAAINHLEKPGLVFHDLDNHGIQEICLSRSGKECMEGLLLPIVIPSEARVEGSLATQKPQGFLNGLINGLVRILERRS